eukprot:16448804-Heterocapsa_arctica.AAC.1
MAVRLPSQARSACQFKSVVDGMITSTLGARCWMRPDCDRLVAPPCPRSSSLRCRSTRRCGSLSRVPKRRRLPTGGGVGSYMHRAAALFYNDGAIKIESEPVATVSGAPPQGLDKVVTA